MQSQPIVHVVDDDQAMRNSICWLLDSVNLQVRTYATTNDFLVNYNPEEESCLLLDVRLPGGSGLELQQQLAKTDKYLPIVFITGYGDIPMAVKAMQNGAVDFLTKPFNDQVLIDSINRAVKCARYQRLQRQQQDAIEARIQILTPRELEIARLIVAGKSNKIVAQHLGISHKTVEIHRSRVMSKTKTKTIAELVSLFLQYDK